MSKMASRFLVLALIGIISSPLFASDPTTPIEKLMEQLGHEKFTVREAASKAILARGPASLPILIASKNHSDIEVKCRIEKLIEKLTLAKALEPTRITLSAKNKTLQEILIEIENQSGYVLVAEPELKDQRLTVEITNKPFWEALESIASRAGTSISPRLIGKTIDLRKASIAKSRVWIDGVFRIEMRKPIPQKVDGITQGYPFEVNLWVMGEPKLWLREIHQPCIETALDDQKYSLKMMSSASDDMTNFIRDHGSINGPFQNIFGTKSFGLCWTENIPKKISELRGEIFTTFVIERNPILLTDDFLKGKGKSVSVNNVKIEVLSTRKDNSGLYIIELSLPPQRNEDRDYWMYRFHLQDENGKDLKLQETRTTKSANRYQMSLRYQIPKNSKIGPPKKFLVDEWVTIQHSVKFEFRDVPIP